MDLSKAKELSINGQPVVMLQVGDVILWKKGGEREWKLDENGYIIGVDGKYYQRWYDDSHAIDLNPIPDLNEDAWAVDTESGDLNVDEDFDYFMSESNHFGSPSIYSQFKVSWHGLTSVTLLYRSFCGVNKDVYYKTYNYMVISGLDAPMFESKPSSSTSGILAHTQNDNSTTYHTLTIPCDEGEHHVWICYRKDYGTSSSVVNDRAFVGIPNNYMGGDIPEKQGEELQYEYIQSDDFIVSREGYIRYKIYKTYFSPNGRKQFKTGEYELGEEVPVTPITANYLRFDAVDNPVHIGFNDLSLVTDMEWSKGYEETFFPFTADGVDLNQGETIWLRARGTSISRTKRTFKTSAEVECHGDVRSLLHPTDFEITPLTNNCFYGLFSGSGITTAPELKSMALSNYCYDSMFQEANSLTTAPDLPATTLAYHCYEGMFDNNSGLVHAPAILPATTLPSGVNGVYIYMFNKCINLENAPEIMLNEMSTTQCTNMFNMCEKINYIKVHCIGNWYNQSNWVNGVAETGTFVKPASISIPTGLNGIPNGWEIEGYETHTPITANYLRFDATTNDVHIGVNDLTYFNNSLKYSMGEEEGWTSFPSEGIDLTQGESVWLYGGGMSTQNYTRSFTTSAEVECHGNIMSLYSKASNIVSLGNYAFYGLFSGTNITTAPELPATLLQNYCYQNMFYGCTSLREAPALPARTLKYNCYGSMFQGCTSLTSAPALPATTLSYYCYQNMFYGCTGLTSAPALPATTLASNCYESMFQGCTGLTSAPALPATSLATYCYRKMFRDCTGLTNAPALPATTLAGYCYESMFRDCTGLTNAPALPATTLVGNCYESMFQGCTGLTNAPALPATTLVTYCYLRMFYGCSKLNYIKVGATSWSTSYANSWVTNVSSSGTFVKPADTSIITGIHGIPTGWTVEAA